jgi:ERCC4-type nuclease
VPVLNAADLSKAIQAARMNLPGVDKIYYGVFTSFSQQPAISRNNVMTKTVSMALQASITRYLS